MTNPDSSKATPRLWTLSSSGVFLGHNKKGALPFFILDGDGQWLGRVDTLDHAALIVAAVNAYDKARELAAFLVEREGEVRNRNERLRLYEQAREVLRIRGGDDE